MPFYPQEELWCGPAIMDIVMTWSGRPVSQEDMTVQVHTPGREGMLTSDMTGAARRDGRLAVEINTMEGLMGELGDKQGALDAINRAMAVGDGQQVEYPITLTEIEALP